MAAGKAMAQTSQCTNDPQTFMSWLPEHMSQLGVLCGSGISVRSAVPTARDFIECLLKVCNGYDRMRRHLDTQLPDGVRLRFEGLLEVLQRTVDPRLTLIDRVYFGTDRGGPEPNGSHYTLARIARCRPVVTTNFDVLIEKAMQELSPYWPRAVRYRNDVWGDSTEPALWKIHGTVRTFQNGNWSIDRHAEPAATLKSIARTRHDENRQRFFENLLCNNALLVVGYSGSDDFDISRWLNESPCPRGVYWIAFEGKVGGLKELLKKRGQNTGFGQVLIFDCKDKSPWEKATDITTILRQIADQVDTVGQRVGVPGIRHTWDWESELDSWGKEFLLSDWHKSIVTAELLKHVHRFREAIPVLHDAEKEAGSDPLRLARTRLFLAEAEVEPGDPALRSQALGHANAALDLSRWGIDAHAARIAYAQALRLAPSPDADHRTAARILRGVFEDPAVDEFNRARAAGELLRLGYHTDTPWLDPVELEEVKRGDIYVEALVSHEEAKTAWARVENGNDLKQQIRKLKSVAELREKLGDVRGLCATTNVLGAMYQTLADWYADGSPAVAGVQTEAKNGAETKHVRSKELA
jgi:NAD-dependent SIR2 family protein deacetylase